MTLQEALDARGRTVTLTREGERSWRRTVTVTAIGRLGTGQLMLEATDGRAYDLMRHQIDVVAGPGEGSGG